MEEQKHSDPKKSFVIVMGSQDSGKSMLVRGLRGETLEVKKPAQKIEYALEKSNKPRPAIKDRSYDYETKICTAYPAAGFNEPGIVLYDTPGMYSRDEGLKEEYLKQVQSLLEQTTPIQGIVLTFDQYDFQRNRHAVPWNPWQVIVAKFAGWFAKVETVEEIASSICIVIQGVSEGLLAVANIVTYAEQVAEEIEASKARLINLQKQQALLSIFYKKYKKENIKNPRTEGNSERDALKDYMDEQRVEHVLFIDQDELADSIKDVKKAIDEFKGIGSNVFANNSDDVVVPQQHYAHWPVRQKKEEQGTQAEDDEEEKNLQQATKPSAKGGNKKWFVLPSLLGSGGLLARWYTKKKAEAKEKAIEKEKDKKRKV